jgi:hypothetical protein
VCVCVSCMYVCARACVRAFIPVVEKEQNSFWSEFLLVTEERWCELLFEFGRSDTVAEELHICPTYRYYSEERYFCSPEKTWSEGSPCSPASARPNSLVPTSTTNLHRTGRLDGPLPCADHALHAPLLPVVCPATPAT